MTVQDEQRTIDQEGTEYSDDALAEMIESFQQEGERLLRLARGAREELRQRMIDREATVLDTEHWSGKLTPGRIFYAVDDVDRFHDRLMALVSSRDLAAAFVHPAPPPMHVDHRGLNELYKRGGDIAAVIDEERHSVRGDPTLTLKRKPEAQRKEQP